jgi:transcription termination/antitermination protein NusG
MSDEELQDGTAEEMMDVPEDTMSESEATEAQEELSHEKSKADEKARQAIPDIAASKASGKRDPFVVRKDAVVMPVINTGIEVARQALPTIRGAREVVEEPVEEEKPEKPTEDSIPDEAKHAHIYALRTTANREEQVTSFIASNAARKKLGVYSVIAPHGMRGYIFLEAQDRHEAEQAAFGVPYAKGLLPSEIEYKEIEHMLEQVKKDVNIQKNDIAEILSGPFKREKCKITRVDKAKEEVVVELLEAAVPIPITLKIDAVKVIRRDEK